MKLIHAILVGLLFTAAMVVWLAFLPVPEMLAGAAHPDYPAMSIGGDGSRSAGRLLPIWLWQVAVIITSILMIAMGISSRHRSRGVVVALAIVALVMLGSWTMLVLSYREVLATGKTAYAFGFPIASAWMIYGTWLSQALLTALYCFGFRKFIFTPEDEQAFQAIVTRAQADKLAAAQTEGDA